MNWIKKILLSLVVLIPLIGTVACENLIPKVQQGIDVAHNASTQAASVIDDLQVQINALPVNDPLRAVLQTRLDKVVKAKDEADKYIATAQGVLNTLNGGTLDPATISVVGSLPYGGYVVGVIGLIGAVLKNRQAASTLTHLTNVVNSVEQAGLVTDDEDKAALAVFQGPATSAVVDEIKQKLDAAPAATEIPA